MSDETPDASLSRFEAQLASLSPQSRLDRERLVFAAGQRSVQRKLRTANRLLLAGNLALAAVTAVAIAGNWRSEGTSAPTPPTGGSMVLADGERDAPAGRSESLASAEPYANYRLLQAWHGDAGSQLSAVMAPGSEQEPATTPSRLHLNRLLRESLETL